MNTLISPKILTSTMQSDFARRTSLWSSCQLLLVSPEQYDVASQCFSEAAIECIEHSQHLHDCLAKLARQRFGSIGVTSASITSLIEADMDAAEKMRRLCSEWTLFTIRSVDPSASSLRKQLHSVGFYEIAEITHNNLRNFDNSSVSGLPDGRFELESTRPAIFSEGQSQVLLASRFALSSNSKNPWTHYGNPLRAVGANGISSSDGTEIGLATHEVLGESPENSTLTVKANISWEQAGTEGAFAGLVGSYSGPGDSNMYVAIADSYAKPFAQISVWRCDSNWERIAYTHLPLQADNPTPCIELALEITATAVEVRVAGVPVLWVYDALIPRTNFYGIRMRGNKFTISDISAVQVQT